MTRTQSMAAAIAVLLTACGGNEDPAARPLPAAPAAGVIGDGRLPQLVEWARASQGAPAMVVMLVRNGQVVELEAVGRRSAAGSVSVTTGDQWHIGSMTKAMTATLAAVLVEDGVITWDTTPLDVWPELTSDIHASFRNITLRQLLSHTSGLKRDDDYGPAADSATGTSTQKRRAWAADLLRQAPAFAAGELHYSNVGYVVAGAMLEARAAMPWETAMTNLVFAPLGMTQSGFGPPGTAGALDEPLGHESRSSGFSPVDPGASDADIRRAMGPAGNVHVTPADYARFMLAHLAGLRGTPGLVSAASFQTLHQPVTPNYALGWEVVPTFQHLGVSGIGHNGSNLRWFSVVWLAPSLDAGLMIATNGGGERGSAALVALDGLMRQRLMASP